jgi:hypothetical protein
VNTPVYCGYSLLGGSNVLHKGGQIFKKRSNLLLLVLKLLHRGSNFFKIQKYFLGTKTNFILINRKKNKTKKYLILTFLLWENARIEEFKKYESRQTNGEYQ